MNFFEKLFKKQSDEGLYEKNGLVQQDTEVGKQLLNPNYEVMALEKKEIRELKRFFEPIVKKVVREAEKKGLTLEKTYKAVIPPEFVEGIKSGKFKLMEADDGSLLPNIVDGKNHIIKKIRLEEMELKPRDISTVNQLSDKILNRKLDAISEQLEVISDLAKEISQQLKNQTYGKVIGAIKTIEQSNFEKKRNRRLSIQDKAQILLNEAASVLKQDIENSLQYFIEWEKRTPFFNTYSAKNLERKFNQLMKDYLFLTTAKSTVVNLKKDQGIRIEKLLPMTKDLSEVDRAFKEVGISSWLPPQNNENKWQHDLMNQMELNNAQLVIEYKTDKYLEEGSES